MTDAAIIVEGLSKRFGSVGALDGIDFQVPTGTVLGLLGPNGAGKTTTVRILTTILHPDHGRATILGRDVLRQPHAVRSIIGLAGQYAAVDENLTGRENLRLVADLTHQPRAVIAPRASELLERFDLTKAADRPVRTYSGGMRRRLDLALALVHRPPVLFLDEPTTGLDPRGRNELWETIGALVADGMTLLLTTQYLEEAEKLANDIVVIDGGKIIAHGTAEELKQRLGATIVEVRLCDPAKARRAKTRLATLGASEVLEDGQTVALTVHDGGRAAVESVRLLDAAGLVPERLTVREPTLDDVFLKLTGHRTTAEIEDEESATAAAAAGRGRKRGAA
jgi:ABC-2 type transport system ATP-binding protein